MANTRRAAWTLRSSPPAPAILRPMDGRLVLKNCSVFCPDGRVRSAMAVLIEGGKISKVAPDDEIPILPGDWEVACEARVVAPGLVDCHAHLVGGQLVPLSGQFLLKPRRQRFEALQDMESRLLPAEVEALTAFAIASALRSGVTMTVEHLHCPSDAAGGLAAQARTAERLGMRFVNSHATHSGFGAGSAMEQLEANAAQAVERKNHPLVRCALGFHASFACDDALLSRLGRLRVELGVGVHGHVAESEDDVAITSSRFGQRIVPRLEAQGLLGSGCVAAHATAIDQLDSQRLAKTATVVALSPLRNLIEEPTGASWEFLAPDEGLISLGTAGSTLLREEIASAFASMVQWARLGRGRDPDALISAFLLHTPAKFCTGIFGEPSGKVEPGNQADLVVYDLVPFAEGPVGLGGLLLQIVRSPVAWTIVAGRVVVREGRLLAHDFRELAKDAQGALQSIGSRAGAMSASASKSVPPLP